MSEDQTPLTPEQQASLDRFVKCNKAINMKHFDLDVKESWFHSDWSFHINEWIKDHNPFGGYIYVPSADEYINKPWKDRSVWYFWYKDALISGNGKTIFGSKRDRKKVEDFIKKNHPIQFFIRKVGFSWKCKLSRFYDWCSETLNPRQKWFTKQIRKDWCDKVTLIVDINFAMVVHFIEGEEALDVTDWEASSEQADQFSKELVACYKWIKEERPALQDKFDNSYPDEETMTGDYHVDYAEHNRLEKLLDDGDTKWLTWIVVNRGFFWT